MIPGVWIILATLLSVAPAADATQPATAAFRAEHKVLHGELDAIADLVGEINSLPEDKRKAAMAKVVDFIATKIAPHAGFEERSLYPLVDQKAGTEVNTFTATMCHEHRIVERWLGELKVMADNPAPNAEAFVHKADNLIGLIVAHFENEEEVLLPVLDRTMTAEEFEKAVHEGAAEHE